MAKVLTDKTIKALKAGVARVEVPDGHLSGLYCVVQTSGVKSWAVRYRFAGKPKKFTIGAYPAVSLQAARQIANMTLEAVAAGKDPCIEKKEAREAEDAGVQDEIEAIYKRYFERYVKLNTKPNSQDSTQNAFNKYILPFFKGRAVQSIKRKEIVRLLDSIVEAGKPIMANRVFAALSTFFGWCLEREIIEVSPMLGAKKPASETHRERALNEDEIKLVLAAADMESGPFGPFIRILLLTGARRDEVAGMRWSEVSEFWDSWLIPSQRTKNGFGHEIALSDQMKALLKSIPVMQTADGPSEYVLTTNGTSPIQGYGRLKKRLDANILSLMKAKAEENGLDPEAVKPIPKWTLHDLRRTFATGLAALGVVQTVTEKCLNHKSGTLSGVAGIYQQHEFRTEMRNAVIAWARYVEAIVKGEVGNNVIELKARRNE